ncbi:hypothetical protein, partial [Anaerolinea sp.]
TSYLVTEPMPLGAEAQSKIAEDAYQQSLSMPTVVSGEEAFNRSMQEGAMKSAEAVPMSPSEGVRKGSAASIRIAGNRTFVWKENEWVDTLFDPDRMKPVEIPFLSNAYFQLVQSDPQAASALALGERVLVVVGGKAYRVVPMAEEGTPVPTLELPTPKPPKNTDMITPLVSTPEAEKSSSRIGLCSSVGLFPLSAIVALFLLARKRK